MTGTQKIAGWTERSAFLGGHALDSGLGSFATFRTHIAQKRKAVAGKT